MKRMILFAAILALILGLACGRSSEKAAEKAAEKSIEKAMGGDADVDISEEGMEMKTETEEGTMSLSAGDKAKVPEDFPSDVYVYEGAAVDMVMDHPEAFMVMLSTDDPLSKVVDIYKKKLTSEGWTKQTAMDMGDTQMLLYVKDDRMAKVTVADDEGVTRINLTADRK